jgi:hypothetical protein
MLQARGLHLQKKTATAALISALLFSMLIGMQCINKAKAETLGPIEAWYNTRNSVKILSPQNEKYNVS